MKARTLIVRALFLTLLLSPVGIRAFGSPIARTSCRIPAHLPRQHNGQADISSHRALLVLASHRSPVQRIHRLRAKRINVDVAWLAAPNASVIAPQILSATRLVSPELGGTNPPRAPPLLSL